MLKKSIKIQLTYILRKKSTIAVFFILLALVGTNFIENMNRNIASLYISQMYDLVKMLTLSDWTTVGYFFMQYYPLLLVIPTACLYISDKNSGVDIYLQSRVGKRNYFYGKIISVFLTTLIVFTFPFLTELILSMVCFSIQSKGDPSGFEYWQTIADDSGYFLSNVFLNNRILYALIMIALFGIVSAILATFNFAITMLPVFKFRLMTYFPIYILFYVLSIIEKIVKLKFTTYYAFILRMFEITKTKNYTVYMVFLGGLLVLSALLIEIKVRRDSL